MILTQTVDIPLDRRVYFDFEVPQNVPSGRAQVELKVVPFPKKEEKTPERAQPSAAKMDKPTIKEDGKIHFTRKQWDEMMNNCPHTRALDGI